MCAKDALQLYAVYIYEPTMPANKPIVSAYNPNQAVAGLVTSNS